VVPFSTAKQKAVVVLSHRTTQFPGRFTRFQLGKPIFDAMLVT